MSRHTAVAAPPPVSDPQDTDRWLALAVVLAGAFMILLDGTIVNVAIPAIQVDLGASYSAIEWVVSGYALAYGLFLIPVGRLGDRFGHKRLFLLGLAGFTATSAFCGTAGSPGALIGWRVAQGAMAGVLNPAILAIIQIVFPPRERGRAFGLYGAVSGIAVALGPLLGGLLIQWNVGDLDWRPIFLLNLPLGVLTLIAAGRLLRESRGRGGALDVVGIVLVSAAVLLLTVPLVEGRAAGWPAWAFVCLVAAGPAFALFAAWEAWRIRRGAEPLVDVRLFRNRAFAAGVAIGLTFFAGFIGLIFALSLYLQIGLGRSALAAGLILLPFAAGSFVGAAVSDRVADRLGRWVLLLGSGLVIAGVGGLLATIRLAGVDVSGWETLPSLLVAGVGSGLVIAPNVDIVLAGVPWQDAGSAGGVLNTAQRLGQALGVAVVGIALFGSLAANGERAASGAVPELRAGLAAAGLDPAAVEGAVDGFVRCFEERAAAADPGAVPASCHPSAADDPAAAAFGEAAEAALRANFTHAIQVAALCALAAVVATFLLVFLVPKTRRGDEAW